jgi:hypothetical protein
MRLSKSAHEAQARVDHYRVSLLAESSKKAYVPLPNAVADTGCTAPLLIPQSFFDRLDMRLQTHHLDNLHTPAGTFHGFRINLNIRLADVEIFEVPAIVVPDRNLAQPVVGHPLLEPFVITLREGKAHFEPNWEVFKNWGAQKTGTKPRSLRQLLPATRTKLRRTG